VGAASAARTLAIAAEAAPTKADVEEVLPAAVNDATFGQIVRCELNRDAVARENTNIVLTHFSRDVRSHNVTIFEFYPKSRVGKRLGNDAFHLDGFFFCQGPQVSVQKRPANCAEINGVMQCGKPLNEWQFSNWYRLHRPIRSLARWITRRFEDLGEFGTRNDDCTKSHEML